MNAIAITGGGRGIGLATAQLAAERGMRVAVGDIDPAAAEEAVAGLDGVSAHQLDVRDRNSFAAFLDAAEQSAGAPLDALINNAGVMLLGRVTELTPERIDAMIDINLRGVINGTQLALERFRARGVGKIVNTASTAGEWGIRGASVYSATKFGVIGFSQAVRQELRGDGEPIEISVLIPGIVNTRLTRGVPHAKTPTAEPEDIAKVALKALNGKRFIYHAPPIVGPVIRTFDMLPRAVNARLQRALGFQDPLWKVDESGRDSYDSEVARST
jgi:NAD(P)-dependent dehydrogenase (short-subunit alcohol dehydrogenase family)